MSQCTTDYNEIIYIKKKAAEHVELSVWKGKIIVAKQKNAYVPGFCCVQPNHFFNTKKYRKNKNINTEKYFQNRKNKTICHSGANQARKLSVNYMGDAAIQRIITKWGSDCLTQGGYSLAFFFSSRYHLTPATS